MKQLLLVFMAVIIITSCNKQASNQLAQEKITIAEARIKYKVDLIADWDIKFSTARGNKPPRPNEATLVTVSFDLCASISGTTFTGCVSENAYTAGGQKFADTTTNDGAIGLWGCGRWYSSPPGPGTTTTCQTENIGYYRVYSADFTTYDIHLSYFKAAP